MGKIKEIMQEGQEFIAANLKECCKDELEWQTTALLNQEGKLREAANIFAKVDPAHAIAIAQNEVARQAMQLIARD